MNETIVSVIVLTYNQKAYLRQALDSILMQKTQFAFEILIGDDASADGTSEIVTEYARKYPDVIRAFVREKNLGATGNLYDLLGRARGKYIASCEGDDYWTDSKKLQIQVEFLESHPEYSGCTHICSLVDENGNALDEPEPKWICRKTEYTLKDFKGICLPGQPATLVHKNFFLDKTHDYSIIHRANPMVADRTIMLILALQGPVHRFDRTMSCYRKNTRGGAQSATAVAFRNNQDVNRMQVEITKKLERYAQEEFGVQVRFARFKLEQRLKAVIKQCLRKVRR